MPTLLWGWTITGQVDERTPATLAGASGMMRS